MLSFIGHLTVVLKQQKISCSLQKLQYQLVQVRHSGKDLVCKSSAVLDLLTIARNKTQMGRQSAITRIVGKQQVLHVDVYLTEVALGAVLAGKRDRRR